MTTSAPDQVLARIKKLLALGQDKSSPEEAALAAAEAQRLMLKYQVESAMLKDGPAPVVEQAVQEASGKSRVQMWQPMLAGMLAKRLNVEVFRYRGTDEVRAIVRSTDVAALAVLYHHLKNELGREAEKAWNQKPKSERAYLTQLDGGKVRWIDTFHRGARETIDARMREQQERVAAEYDSSRGAALVLMSRYADEAKAAIVKYQQDHDLKFRSTTRRSTAAGGGAYEAGRDAGARASLSPNARALAGR